MSNAFIALLYDDVYTTQETRLRLLRMQKEYLIDLEDAVVAVCDERGLELRKSTVDLKFRAPNRK